MCFDSWICHEEVGDRSENHLSFVTVLGGSFLNLVFEFGFGN